MAGPRGNRLLAHLSAPDYRALEPHLEVTRVRQYAEIAPAGAPLPYAHFPMTALLSSINDVDRGERSVEVGAVGNEGMVGLPVVLGPAIAPHRVIVQMAGDSARIAAGDLARIVEERPAVRALLLRYAHASTVSLAQVTACNAVHQLLQRLARWLLTFSDRAEERELELTQEFLAQMLGVLRPAVSVAAGYLQDREIISYVRGCITILDRDRLRGASCECYEVMKTAAESVFADANGNDDRGVDPS